MTEFEDLSKEQQIASLAGTVQEILGQYDLRVADVENLNHEFNSTFKVVDAAGDKFALRVNVNSNRSLQNLNAEIFWVNQIRSVIVPKPLASASGDYVTFGFHEATNQKLPAVLYTWLDGEEPGDEPTDEQLFAMGAAMAKLHLEAINLSFPEGSSLKDYSDFFWQEKDLLLSEESELTREEKALIAQVKEKVERVVAQLSLQDSKRPIHADLHPWNVMWHEGSLAVFDFDDSGIGLPVQDLATAIYYLDTPEQEVALLAGYQSVALPPEYSEEQMKLLLLQRRLLLLNYLYETSNVEHRAMIPKYKSESIRRVREILASYLG